MSIPQEHTQHNRPEERRSEPRLKAAIEAMDRVRPGLPRATARLRAELDKLETSLAKGPALHDWKMRGLRWITEPRDLGGGVFAHLDGPAIVLEKTQTGCRIALDPDVWRALVAFVLEGIDRPRIEIKHRVTGAILHTVNAPNLRGADLTGADLTEAYLQGADLTEAYLQGADLQGADLQGADLQGAYLRGANLRGANLWGAIMPDGRTYDQWRADPLAGLCDTPEATDRAIAAWGAHTWRDCPMHAAHGWNGVEAAPEQKRQLVATFVALFDGRLLPAPQPQPQQGSETGLWPREGFTYGACQTEGCGT